MRRRPRQQTAMDEIHRDIDAQKKACPICGVPLARWVAYGVLISAVVWCIYYLTTYNTWRDESKDVAQHTVKHLCKLLMANWTLGSDKDNVRRVAAFLLKLAPGELERRDSERGSEIRHIHDSYDTMRSPIIDARDTNAEILYQFLQEEMHANLGKRSTCEPLVEVHDRVSDALGYYSEVFLTATTRNNASKRNVAYRVSGKLRLTSDRGVLLFETRITWKRQ